MLLQEFFTFDRNTLEDEEDLSTDIDPGWDRTQNVRQVSLTLGQIKIARQASDFHLQEKLKEVEDIQRMYKAPEAPAI